jgi:hypothetical protein
MKNQFHKIKDFYIPVLRVMMELGGSAKLEDICELFYKK